MRWLVRLLRTLRRDDADGAAIDDEIRLHLELEADDLCRLGLSGDEAERRARLAFGGAAQYRAAIDDVRRVRSVESLLFDLRHAARALWRPPGASVISIATIGIALTFVVTVVTVVNAVFMRPWPVPEPHRVFRVFLSPQLTDATSQANLAMAPYRDVEHLAEGATRAEVVAFHRFCVRLDPGATNAAECERGHIVSHNFFDVLAIPLQYGRPFNMADRDQPVAIVSHALWRRVFAADPGAVGRVIDISGTATTIVGVTAPEFPGLPPEPTDVYVPFPSAAGWTNAWRTWWGEAADIDPGRLVVEAAVRLRGPWNRADVLAELNVLHRQTDISTEPVRSVTLLETSLGTDPQMPGTVPVFFALVFAASVVVLALACANVANLQLARGLSRGRELATRLALGATRARVIRQLLLEGLMLSGVATAAAFAAAFVVPGFIAGLFDAGTQVLRLTPDLTVAAFATAACVAATLMFTLFPALQVSRTPSLLGALHTGRTTGRPIGRTRTLALAFQVMVSTVLLVGATLLARGIASAVSPDRLGFDIDMVAGLINRTGDGGTSRDVATPRSAIADALTGTGLIDVTFALRLPLARGRGHFVETVRVGSDPGVQYTVATETVASNFFRVLRIPFVTGRSFSDDRGRREVVVNVALANLFALSDAPMGWPLVMDDGVHTVVGVIENARLDSLEAAAPTVFRPFESSDTAPSMSVPLVRASPGDRRRIAPVLEAAFPDIRWRILPLVDVADSVVRQGRFGARLALGIGTVALALTLAGLFGLFAFVVEERRQEIGIRVALGATPRQVLRLVFASTQIALLVGLAAGLVGGSAAGTLLDSFLYGLSPLDLWSYAIVGAILAAAAAVATYVPLRRALRVDPALTLRSE